MNQQHSILNREDFSEDSDDESSSYQAYRRQKEQQQQQQQELLELKPQMDPPFYRSSLNFGDQEDDDFDEASDSDQSEQQSQSTVVTRRLNLLDGGSGGSGGGGIEQVRGLQFSSLDQCIQYHVKCGGSDFKSLLTTNEQLREILNVFLDELDKGERQQRNKQDSDDDDEDDDDEDTVGRLFSYHFVKHGGTPFMLQLLLAVVVSHHDDTSTMELYVDAMIVLNMLSHEYEEALERVICWDSLAALVLRQILQRAHTNKHVELMSRVIQLLTIICHTAFDQRGFWIALDVISHVQKTGLRFNVLIQWLTSHDESHDDDDEDEYQSLQKSILALLNSLINKPDDINLKRYLIDEMVECGLLEMIEQLRSEEHLSGHIEFIEDQMDKVDEQEVEQSQTTSVHALFNQVVVQLPNANSYFVMNSVLNHLMNALRSFDKRENNLSLVSSVLGQCIRVDGTVIDVFKNRASMTVPSSPLRELPAPSKVEAFPSKDQVSGEKIKQVILESNPTIAKETTDPVQLVKLLCDEQVAANQNQAHLEQEVKKAWRVTTGFGLLAVAAMTFIVWNRK